MQSEAEFQSAVMELAAMTGWRVWHDFGCEHTKFTLPGFPDLVMVRGSQLLFAELKSRRGRVTAAQQGWLDALGSVDGVTVRVWRPDDWDEILEVLQ